MEELAINCIKDAYPDAEVKVKLPNTIDKSPKTVEIDCLVGNKAYEIKWKDAWRYLKQETGYDLKKLLRKLKE